MALYDDLKKKQEELQKQQIEVEKQLKEITSVTTKAFKKSKRL